jgi:DNA-binding LacI/PurR family transcriptional regulator
MADVAERAGVSKSTVSLVLNNRPSVSPELRQAVLKAADELGYRPPGRRSQRRSSENRSIIVVHYEIGSAASQTPSIFLDYVAGIQAFARDKKVNLTFITDYREERQQLGFHLLSNEHLPADGAILMGWGARRDGQLLHRFLDKGLPIVVLSRNWPDLPISTVGQDHHQQACIALDYLIGLGHIEIAFLASKADRRHEWFDWRLECYRKTILRISDRVDEDLIAIGKNGYEAAQALMARRPDVTAIFAIEDANALAAVRGLQEMELRVPEDVSVIGLDDTSKPPEGCPALTTVAFPHSEVGYLAAELLLKQIESKELYYSNVVVRSKLVERDSCAPPRGKKV